MKILAVITFLWSLIFCDHCKNFHTGCTNEARGLLAAWEPLQELLFSSEDIVVFLLIFSSCAFHSCLFIAGPLQQADGVTGLDNNIL